jgi:hypothetical protein
MLTETVISSAGIVAKHGDTVLCFDRALKKNTSRCHLQAWAFMASNSIAISIISHDHGDDDGQQQRTISLGLIIAQTMFLMMIE